MGQNLDWALAAVSDRGDVEVNEYLVTNVPDIFAAGDVIGRSAFTRTKVRTYNQR